VASKVGFFRWVLRLLAVGYPLALLVAVLGLRLLGERWWVTTAALYLPRGWLALPLPFITLALLVWGPRRLLAAQLIALALVIFPLLGLSFSLSRTPSPGAQRLRVVSYNVATGPHGTLALMEQLHAANPDVILIQESSPGTNRALRASFPELEVRAHVDFAIASRFPVTELGGATELAEPVRSRAFARYRIETPAGAVRVYNLHLTSPHAALEELLGAGLRHEVASGHLFQFAAAPDVAANAAVRAAEAQAVADDAAASPDPVIIAGDTNLPGLSWAFARWLGRYQDGFVTVGNGLGYTFPAPKRPWMRIDRVLAGPRFRFLSFEVLPRGPSDHRGVVAELELAPAPR